jgi:V/A-type H+-transporting ATPase subunit C
MKLKLRKRKVKKKAAKRIKFKTYPYTVTRVRVMKSKLLGEEDYLRMKKMGTSEITRFLEESEYKTEIDSLSKDYRGTELIELALNENLAHVINKLLMISLKNEVKQLIQFYSLKWILNNMKLVLRTRMNKLGEEDLKYGIIPINPTSYEKCLKMYKDDAEEFAEELSAITGIDIEKLKELYNANNLIALENEIDIDFYSKMIDLKNRMKLRKNDPLRQFFDHLVTLMNIKNIVRFKREGISEDIIRKLIVIENPLKLDMKMSKRLLSIRRRRMGDKLMEGMIHAEDVKAVFEKLKESRYKDLATPDVLENPSRLEGSIDKFLLMHASRLLHRRPLSISPIFGFLLTKEIETKNIKLLVHAKAMGLDEKVIDNNLIVIHDSALKRIEGDKARMK